MKLRATKNFNGYAPKCGWKGWSYPNTRFEFNDTYLSLNELIKHVRGFEESNNLPPMEDLADVLEDHFCRTDEFYAQFCSEVKEAGAIGNAVSLLKTYTVGAKALVKLKIKESAKERLRVLDAKEINERIDTCAACPLNKYKDNNGHESMYKSFLEESYGKSIDEMDAEHGRSSELGICSQGCECKLKSKVYLAVEDYGHELLELPIARINNMVNGRPAGDMCWQLKDVFLPEHLEVIKHQNGVKKEQLKEWGYIK